MEQSYFPEETFETRMAGLAERGDAPDWLLDVVTLLGRDAAALPCREDEHRYVTEFVYPH